jgi:hypothetical protein
LADVDLLEDFDDSYEDLTRRWREEQLRQGANEAMRSERKTESQRSADLWAEFDFESSPSTSSSPYPTWREDMERRRNVKGTKRRQIEERDLVGDGEEEEEEMMEEEGSPRSAGDDAVLDELAALLRMWKNDKNRPKGK